MAITVPPEPLSRDREPLVAAHATASGHEKPRPAIRTLYTDRPGLSPSICTRLNRAIDRRRVLAIAGNGLTRESSCVRRDRSTADRMSSVAFHFLAQSPPFTC